jgi:hypothetical protein
MILQPRPRTWRTAQQIGLSRRILWGRIVWPGFRRIRRSVRVLPGVPLGLLFGDLENPRGIDHVDDTMSNPFFE